MSLLPLLFDESMLWRPLTARWGLDDDNNMLQALASPRSLQQYQDYIKALRASLQDTGSQTNVDKDKFQANFDVQHFKPNEITVKVNENTVTIEGKHEEKQDEHGQVFRHFVRKYVLPKNCDTTRVESKLSCDGVLTITAPLLGEKNVGDRRIPIVQTGKPVKAIKQKRFDKKKSKL